jgi:alkylation response protein AidB-like acyl-CoA dehydrogenase
MTAIAELSLGPIAGEPGAPAEDERVAVARDVAVQLAPDAAAREQTAEPPVAEAALFREAGLLPLIAAEEIGGLGRPYAVALTVVRQIARVDSGLARLLAYHYAFSNRQASDLLSAERYRDFERRAVANQWHVASTGTPLGEELVMTGDAVRGYRLEGTKHFATGVKGLAARAERAERAERAAAWALDRGERLTARERAEAATLGAAAKALATQVALDVTTRVFDTIATPSDYR